MYHSFSKFRFFRHPIGLSCISSLTSKNLSEETVMSIINSGDARSIYEYLCEFAFENYSEADSDRPELAEKALLATKDAKWIFRYIFCLEYEYDGPTDFLISAFASLGDPQYLYEFIYKIAGFPVIMDAFLNTGDPKWFYYYLVSIADQQDDVYQALLNTGDTYWIDKANKLPLEYMSMDKVYFKNTSSKKSFSEF